MGGKKLFKTATSDLGTVLDISSGISYQLEMDFLAAVRMGRKQVNTAVTYRHIIT